MRILRPWLFIAAAWLLSASAFAEPKLACTFDRQGLAALTRGPAQFVKAGAFTVGDVLFLQAGGSEKSADRSNPITTFDAATREVSHQWPWGAVRCRYLPAGQRLTFEIVVENRSAEPITGLEFNPIELQFPRRPVGSGWERRFEMWGDNEGDITALVADFGSGVLTLCNDDPTARVRVGFIPSAAPPAETWKVRIAAPQWTGHRTILVAPKAAQTYRFSLRFSAPGIPLKTTAADLFAKLAAAHPFQLQWPDRRPIGMLALSSSAHVSPTNPRGWLNDPKLDVSKPERFRKAMLAAADSSIAILQDMRAQGMVFWNMEGEQFPNINYIGDPRMTATLAPEMEAIAPEFFARFHQAGLRTGVCIRPTRVVPGWDGKAQWQHSSMGFDVVEEMNQKIAYAKKRLGCLLFYVDTNVRWFLKPDGQPEAKLLEVAAFKRLADWHPDILLIPEIPRPDYWSCTAPYRETRPHGFGSHASTDQRALDLYPRAFSIINPIDSPAEERRAEIVAGLRRGDILMFRCWFADAQNKVFKSMLIEAGAGR